MRAATLWKIVTVDETDFLDRLIELLEQHAIHYCVIGGQAVNAYVDPLVSLDLDLVVATDELPELERRLGEQFTVKRFPHSLNVAAPGSDLRLQIQTDARYAAFVAGAQIRRVLGRELPVAAVSDVLAGKVWAAQDPRRRPSKRQKDLADIARLLEAYPELRGRVPEEILGHLL